MNGLLVDLRRAVRSLRRSRTVAVAAIVTLGLGLGVGAALFGLVDAVLLRPLPYPAEDRLFRLGQRWSGHAEPAGSISLVLAVMVLLATGPPARRAARLDAAAALRSE